MWHWDSHDTERRTIDDTRFPLRRPLRTGGDRTGHGEEPLLPGAACDGHRLRHAQHARRNSRGQGRGRLGSRVHGLLFDPSNLRRPPLSVLEPVERRRRQGPGHHGRCGARSRCAGRRRAVARRRRGRQQGDTRGAAISFRNRRAGLDHSSGPASNDGQVRHRPASLVAARRRGEGALGGIRHRLRLCGHGIPAVPVLAVTLQQADRQLWRRLREPCAPAARDDRDHPGSRR